MFGGYELIWDHYSICITFKINETKTKRQNFYKKLENFLQKFEIDSRKN